MTKIRSVARNAIAGKIADDFAEISSFSAEAIA